VSQATRYFCGFLLHFLAPSGEEVELDINAEAVKDTKGKNALTK
jgi:hypothetical protein